MTVAELRAALAGYPDAMPVCVRTDHAGADYFCVPLDTLGVQDIVHEADGGRDDPDDDLVLAVPTLVVNNF